MILESKMDQTKNANAWKSLLARANAFVSNYAYAA